MLARVLHSIAGAFLVSATLSSSIGGARADYVQSLPNGGGVALTLAACNTSDPNQQFGTLPVPGNIPDKDKPPNSVQVCEDAIESGKDHRHTDRQTDTYKEKTQEQKTKKTKSIHCTIDAFIHSQPIVLSFVSQAKPKKTKLLRHAHDAEYA